MQYLTQHYKNLCDQLQEKVNALQAQLSEGAFDEVLSKLNSKKLTIDAPEYIKPNRNRFENNLTDRPIRPEDYSNIKNEIGKRFKNVKFNSINPQNTETDEDIIRMRQTAADQGGIPQDMVNEPIRRTKQTPNGKLIYGESLPKPTMRPNIDANKIFIEPSDKDKLGTEWAPKPWLRPDYVRPEFDAEAHEEMNKVFKPKDTERTPYIQKYGREDAIGSIDPKYLNNNLMDRAVSEINKKKPAGSKIGDIAKNYVNQKASSNSSMFNIGPGK
jgi:hypothetical protein